MKYNTFTLIYKYISYLWKASNGRGHGVHSPFVYAFIKNVLNTKSKGENVDAIELYRQQLLKIKKKSPFLIWGQVPIRREINQERLRKLLKAH